MADDPIARLADILFAANQVGNIASFHRDELEAILRSTHAGGRREMAGGVCPRGRFGCRR